MKKLHCVLFLVFCFLGSNGQPVSEKLDKYLSRPGAFNGTALVVYKGSIMLYKGYGYKNIRENTLNDTATLYRIGSTTKPFTATVILHLAERGLIKLQDPLSKYISQFPGGDSITIDALLTHRSGIKDYLEVPVIQNLPDSAPPVSIEELISSFKNERATIKKGDQFTYSNSNYILLAYIIEKVTRKKYETVVRELIFEPLKMTHSGFDFKNLKTADKSVGHRNVGKRIIVEDFDSTYAPGCGSMYSSAMDLYKWYKGLYSKKVITDSTRENAFHPRNWLYGYGWFSFLSYGKKCISHPGGVPGFVTEFKFFPDDDLCIVLLNNSSMGKVEADKVAAIVLQKRFKRSAM